METIFWYIEGSVGALIMAISGILMIVMAGIVFPIVAFRVAWWWGLLCFLFAGPATLVFSIAHFDRAKVPLLITVGSAVVCIGVFVLRAFLSTLFTVPS
jgi:hypothetical protein